MAAPKLNPHQLQLLQLIADGYTHRQIATRTGHSHDAVKNSGEADGASAGCGQRRQRRRTGLPARAAHGRCAVSLTYLSLFAGIGGLDIGLDRAGWTCAGQVEIDPFCRSVLERHWPEVPRHDDVRTAPAWWLGRGGAAVDMVCGGFPCQPVSTMGKRRAQDDPRWGWPWFADVVRTVRPRYVLVENVPGLLDTGLGDVLGDLSTLGFDAEWTVLSACAFGAPHTRERLFVLAYPAGADGFEAVQVPAALQAGRPVAGAEGGGTGGAGWLPEPAVDRVAHGLPRSVGFDERQALGNAVVPQVAEYLGRLIGDHAQQPIGAAS